MHCDTTNIQLLDRDFNKLGSCLIISVASKASSTYPIVHDGSEPERTRGIWIVPNLWKFSSSMPSAVKQGMSQRMCEPRKSSAEPRIGALGVRRRFCFARTPTVGLLSKMDTKLGIWLPLFHWSWSGIESRESGVALLDREPVLHVYIDKSNFKVNKDDLPQTFVLLILPQHRETRPECQVSFSCFSISSFRVPFDSVPWLSISLLRRDASKVVPKLEPTPTWAVPVPSSRK